MELSVVIAVLLLLVGVLFIGISAWRNGSNATACVLNGARICKHERLSYRQCGRGGYLDGCRLLVDGAHLSGRRYLHISCERASSRKRLRHLQLCHERSHPNGGHLSQLVSMESPMPTHHWDESLTA
jgi:hypothetical protein